jgi:hypothetical protein
MVADREIVRDRCDRIVTEHLQDFDRFLKAVELYLGPTE